MPPSLSLPYLLPSLSPYISSLNFNLILFHSLFFFPVLSLSPLCFLPPCSRRFSSWLFFRSFRFDSFRRKGRQKRRFGRDEFPRVGTGFGRRWRWNRRGGGGIFDSSFESRLHRLLPTPCFSTSSTTCSDRRCQYHHRCICYRIFSHCLLLLLCCCTSSSFPSRCQRCALDGSTAPCLGFVVFRWRQRQPSRSYGPQTKIPASL